jgi:hypothetical protein
VVSEGLVFPVGEDSANLVEEVRLLKNRPCWPLSPEIESNQYDRRRRHSFPTFSQKAWATRCPTLSSAKT